MTRTWVALGAVLLSGVAVLWSTRQRTPAPEAPITASATTSVDVSRPEPQATAPTEVSVAAVDNDDLGCSVPDRGNGPYGAAIPLRDGKLWIGEPPPTSDFTLVLHFHGGEGARRTIAPAGMSVVLWTLDAGTGSSRYAQAFYGAGSVDGLISDVAQQLAPATMSRLVVSAWSAGYGAVRQILIHRPERPDAVILLDGLHASYDNSGAIMTEEIEPFFKLAARAQRGEAVMWFSHSEIVPPSYAGTREVADLLIDELGGRRRYAGLRPIEGVELKTEYRDGNLRIRGFTGTGKKAHCAHLRMLDDALRSVL